MINEKAPRWARKFHHIWKKLTPAQAEALECEYFHGFDEKPSQQESAKKLGISIGSYQERLEWAYRKLEKVYPEFERIKRRKSSQAEVRTAIYGRQPVFDVCIYSGQRTLIELT
jgi:hypothetical protein